MYLIVRKFALWSGPSKLQSVSCYLSPARLEPPNRSKKLAEMPNEPRRDPGATGVSFWPKIKSKWEIPARKWRMKRRAAVYVCIASLTATLTPKSPADDRQTAQSPPSNYHVVEFTAAHLGGMKVPFGILLPQEYSTSSRR